MARDSIKKTDANNNVKHTGNTNQAAVKNIRVAGNSQSTLLESGEFKLSKARKKKKEALPKDDVPENEVPEEEVPVPAKKTGKRKYHGGFPEDIKKLKTFGIRLKQLRKKSGLSLREAAILSGIDNSKIAKIEKGLINITMLTYFQLLDMLSISPKEFWNYESSRLLNDEE